MATDPFSGGVEDDVHAVLDRSREERRKGVVDDDRDAVLVGNGGDRLEVWHVETRVADRLDVDGLRLGVDRGIEFGRLGAVDELEIDAVLRQCVLEEVVRPTVKRRTGNDVIADAGKVEDGERLSRLAGADGQGPDAALESGHALFEYPVGGVHDPGVDVAELLQAEEAGGMVGIVEDVAGCGVDRNRSGLGGGIDHLTCVDGEGFAMKGGRILI